MQITVGPKVAESSIRPVMGAPSSGGFDTKNYAEAQGTATDSTYFDIAVNIPANRKILATSLRVDTELASSDGGTSFTAQFTGGSYLTVTSNGSFSKNTKIDTFHDAVGSSTSAVTSLRITCNDTKTFAAGGKVTAVVYFQALTSLQSV